MLALAAETEVRPGSDIREIATPVALGPDRRSHVRLLASVDGKGTSMLTPERIHARYARKIRRHIAAVLGPDDEREDLVQEVLITVLNKIGTLRDPACLDGWVAQVTANTLKYVMRRRRLRRHASWEDLPDWQMPLVHSDLHARDLASRALNILARLPQKDRLLLAAYWFSPASAESIAEKSGCSIITVRRRLFKAKARFEKLALRDHELAACFHGARRWSRRLAPAAQVASSADAEF
jgi:RNA polymerase sigma-70 factor (ECF subfamily)